MSADGPAAPPAGERAPLHEARQLVNDQAEDEGLWGKAETAMEAYIQAALRELHSAVERATGGETGPRAAGSAPLAVPPGTLQSARKRAIERMVGQGDAAEVVDAVIAAALRAAGPAPEGTSNPLDDPATRQRYEDARKRWEESGRPISEAVRESETLTEQDLALRVMAAGPAPEMGMPSLAAYKALESVADDVNAALNSHGLANWTVCPQCHIDDFVHVEGCSLAGPAGPAEPSGDA